MKNKILFLLFLFLLCVVSVSADNKDLVEKDLSARYSHSNCRAQLSMAQIEALAKIHGTNDLSSQKSTIASDLNGLQALNSVDKKKDFDSAQNSLFKDIVEVDKALRAVRKGLRKLNFTKDSKDTLKTDFQNAQNAYVACTSDADKLSIESSIASYQAQIEAWNNIVSKLKAQNADTSGLEAIINEAQTQVIAGLQKALDAVDSSSRKSALDAVWNLNLHLWENFDIALLRIRLAKLSANATSDDKDKIASVEKLLDDASQLVASGRKYASGDSQQVSADLKQASELIWYIEQTSRIEASIKYYDDLVNKWNGVIAKQKSAGQDTSGLESVVGEIQNQMLPALQKALDATDADSRNVAFSAVQNLNLHLAENFELNRLKLEVAKLPSTSDQGKVAQINSLINTALQLAVAGRQYDKSDAETIRDDIKQASSQISDLVKANRPVRQNNGKHNDEGKSSDKSVSNEVKQ